MITATRNGATKQFTETCWSLLPDDKCGWAKATAPPIEVAAAAAMAANSGWNATAPRSKAPAAARPQPSTLNPQPAQEA